MKNNFRELICFLGKRAPMIVKLILIVIYPIRLLYVLISQWSGLYEGVAKRIWYIHRGPLKGYKLANMLPLEIAPVLLNRMELICSHFLPKLNLKAAIVLDIGSSYGYYTLLMARLVEDGHVYSFEPDWRSYGRLTNNLVKNSISNVTAVPIGVSNSQLALQQWCSQKETPWNSCLADKDHTHNLTLVPVISLDNYFRTLGLQKNIGFIKIDVEGAELEVLKGSMQIIKQSAPPILCELHSAIIAKEIFNFFSGVNYEWEMVEYITEYRQHIIAFPVDEAKKYRRLLTQ